MTRSGRRIGFIGAGLLVLVALGAILAPLLAANGPSELSGAPFQSPSAEFPLGTDDVGHDLFAQLLYGARVSLAIGLISATVATVIGLGIAFLAGYARGRAEAPLMRVVDLALAFPFFVLVIVLAIGVPAASLLGLPVDAVTRGLIGPVISLLGYFLLVAAFIAAIFSTALYEALSRLGIGLPAPLTPQELDRLPEIREYTIDQLEGPLMTIAIGWALVVLLIVIVVRTWVRRRVRARPRDGREERSFSIPSGSFRLEIPKIGGVIRRRRRGTPSDAVSAYLAALDDVAAHDPERARREPESPHAHAARAGIPELGSLQADYALARYGGRHLTDAENRRGVGRWRRLRARLRRV